MSLVNLIKMYTKYIEIENTRGKGVGNEIKQNLLENLWS